MTARISPICAVVLLLASSAEAQPTSPADQPPATAYWELIGGFEGDTNGTGYGFFGPSYVRPIRDGLSFTARVFFNYLYYEFPNGLVDGLTTVRSPGINTAAGLRFGGTNFATVYAGPSVRFRREKVEGLGFPTFEDSDTVVGFSVGGDVFANPTPTGNIHAIVDYGSADEYIWSRIAYKEHIINRDWSKPLSTFAGGEFIAQGNEDIRSIQVGGLVEFTHGPSSTSLMVRGGYKRSTFQIGDPRTGPYFGVGFYKQIK